MGNVLITGGAGFIGINLCKRLSQEGYNVYCIDNFFSSNNEQINKLLADSKFVFIEHDVINPLPQTLFNIDFDQIYHLACPASPPRYQKDHIYTLRVNFEGTLNLLNFAKAQKDRLGKSPKLLFSSTSEVYGDPKESPQKESYRGDVNPHGVRSCYDEGKRVSESLCMNFWRQHDVDVKIVRIFNTYGPFMDKDDGRVVSNFIIQALKGDSLTVYGDGTQTRSFQYIEDLIDGFIKYMELDEVFPGPINLGNPHEMKVSELAEVIINLSNSTSLLVFSELPKDDPMQRKPDISLAKSKLGWEPSVNIREGIKKTIEYFKLVV